MMTMEFKYDFYIDADREKVWNALVSPEGTRAAFFNCVLDSSLTEGAPFAYVGPGAEGNKTVHVYGTVLASEPGHKLVLLEHPGPSYHENHAELESRITYSLETVGRCTKLTLVNDQFTPDHPSVVNANQSWWMVLSSLKTYAETGKVLDYGW